MTEPVSIVVWVPALRPGTSWNRAGMRGAGTPYRTRAEALRHEHWNNQAHGATARRVDVYDCERPTLHLTADAEVVVGAIALSARPEVVDLIERRLYGQAVAAWLGIDP